VYKKIILKGKGPGMVTYFFDGMVIVVVVVVVMVIWM